MRSFKAIALIVLFTILFPLVSSCSAETSTQNIRATLFLLDASKSSILSIQAREQQLKERLAGAFREKNQEAIYFDFIRSNFSKQLILPLVSMQTILGVNEEVLSYAKDDRVRRETRELISAIWTQSISDSKSVNMCISEVSRNLDTNSVLEEGSRVVAQYICISASKAKETLANIRRIGLGERIDTDFIGSDIEGAFTRGLQKLESESRSLINGKNENVGVRATIVVSSDMMQRDNRGDKIIDVVRNMTEEQIENYLMESRNQQDIRNLTPIVKIDGWASTKKNYPEKDRNALELYWKRWFTTLGLSEPDFGLGVIDWSVDI